MTDLSQIPDDQLIQIYATQAQNALTANPDPSQIGIWAGIKRGMGKADIGLDQAANTLQTATQNYLPSSVANVLNYEPGVGVPTAQDLKNQHDILENADQDIVNQGNNTGVRGAIGEALGDFKSYIPGDNLITQGAKYGAADALLGGKPVDSGIAGRIAQAAIEAPVSSATSLVSGKALSALLGPASNTLSASKKALVDALQGSGIDLSPAQKTGNPLYSAIEGILPGTNDNQASQFTNAVLNKAGIDSDSITPEVLQSGFQKIGSNIANITKPYSIPVTPELNGNLKSSLSNNNLEDAEKSKIGRYIDMILGGAETTTPAANEGAYLGIQGATPKANKAIPGSHYQSMRSQIGDAQRSAFKTGNSEYGNALSDLKDTLDSHMDAQLSPQEQLTLQAERQKYANLSAISDAVKPTGQATVDETINPKNLASALSSQNKRMYAQGYGDLNKLAQGGVKVLGSSIIPNNPAVTGAGKVAEGGLGALLGHILGGPEGAGVGMAAGIGAPYVAKNIYNNPGVQSYLMNGIPIKGISPEKLGSILNQIGQVTGRGVTATTPMRDFAQ